MTRSRYQRRPTIFSKDDGSTPTHCGTSSKINPRLGPLRAVMRCTPKFIAIAFHHTISKFGVFPRCRVPDTPDMAARKLLKALERLAAISTTFRIADDV